MSSINLSVYLLLAIGLLSATPIFAVLSDKYQTRRVNTRLRKNHLSLKLTLRIKFPF